MSFLILLLFAYSIILLLRRKTTISILLFVVFATKGLCIIPETEGGFRLTYAAFLYAVFATIYYRKQISSFFCEDAEIFNRLIIFLSFITVSCFFSIVYYGFSPTTCITTALRYFVLLGLYCFTILKKHEYDQLLKWLYYITFVTSILYIGQCVTGVQLLAYNLDVHDVPASNGLYRFYNKPPLNNLFLFIALFVKEKLPQKTRGIAAIVFILTVLLSNGRTDIGVTILNILMIAFFIGNLKKYLKIIVPLGLAFYLTSNLVFDRMNKDGKTKEDLSMILEGKWYIADYQSQNGLTMLYRFAWVAERVDYLSERPFVESLFGLGLMTDDSPDIVKKYHFRYGLRNDRGRVAQLRTPDIAWGNFVTLYGLAGIFIFFMFYFSLAKKMYVYRRTHRMAIVLFTMLICDLLGSFSGSNISEPYYMMPYFFVFVYILKEIKHKKMYHTKYKNSISE